MLSGHFLETNRLMMSVINVYDIVKHIPQLCYYTKKWTGSVGAFSKVVGWGCSKVSCVSHRNHHS